MRLPCPLPDLRSRAASADRELEETRFVVCRAPTGNDFCSPTLLSEPANAPDHPLGSNPRSTGTASTPTVVNVKTTLVMGAIGLLALMVMACGPGDAPSSPEADRPTVVAVTQQDAGNAAGNGQQAQTQNEQPSDSTPSGSTSDTNPASEPTEQPKPTEAPQATATPEPTATVVPTPDPKVTLFNLLRGFSGPTEVPEYPYLRDHNIELIKKAVAPNIADYVLTEYSDLIWDSKETIQGRVPNYIEDDHVEFEQIPFDGKELHVRVTMQYLQTLPGAVENLHEVTVDAAIATAEPPYEDVGLTIPAHHEGQLARAPIFSRLLGDPVIAEGKEQ